MKIKDILTEGKKIEFEGLTLDVSIDGQNVDIRAIIDDKQVGYVVFDRDGDRLIALDLSVNSEFQRQKIATKMYDYVKSLGFIIYRSPNQLSRGKAFWDNSRGERGKVWEEDDITEAPITDYEFIGDFNKPGPFNALNKKLVQHPVHIEKAYKFFENTQHAFRVFMCNVRGTQKYKESGVWSPEQISKMFSEQDANKILSNYNDAITVIYIGNTGADPVPLTPWIMAHRFGHTLAVAGRYNRGGSIWSEAENQFFSAVNRTLAEYYNKRPLSAPTRIPGQSRSQFLFQLEPEYNALFNAIGTQRSSRTGQIKRPYEFLYEIFAQYIGTSKIKFNPLPTNLGYGRKAWGTPTKYLNLKSEYRGDFDRTYAVENLESTMEYIFNDVLSNAVGKIYLM